MGQTVNLLVFTFGGSNPSSPTKHKVFCGSSSVDRALAFQAEGRGFEPRLPLHCGDVARYVSFFVSIAIFFRPRSCATIVFVVFLHSVIYCLRFLINHDKVH